MRRALLLAALLLVAALWGAAAWWPRPAPGDAPSAHTNVATTRPVPAAPGKADTRKALATAATSAPRKQQDVVPEVASAPGGSADVRLSEAVLALTCSPAASKHAHEEAEAYRRALPSLQQVGKEQANVVATIQARLAALEEHLSRCNGLPEIVRKAGIGVLEQLANTGYPGARVTYVRHAWSDYADLEQGQVIDDIDEVIRRRDLARRYLAQAVANCDDDVWSARFDVQQTGLLPNEPVAQVAAMQAYYRYMMQTGAEAGQLQHIHDTLDAAAQSLDDASRRRAVQLGDADVARCNNSHP